MIDEIHIRDVALIREARFAPCDSLTVITGETGAGKTALLSAIKLLVGERSDAGLVREGGSELSVEGRFFLEGSEEGVVVSRHVNAQGRSRASIDGSLASMKELAQCVGNSVDLCGQHEHQQLLSPAYQRTIFDAWAGEALSQALREYRERLDAVRAAQAELDRLEDLESADSVELDRARFALDQIAAIDPRPEEYESLLERMPRLEHAEMLMHESARAQDSLSGQGGAIEGVESALASLDRIGGIDSRVSEYSDAVREAYYSLEEAARGLATYRDSIDFSAEELEEMQDRLAALQGLMRGFGPRMEDVFELQRSSQEKLDEYEGRDELIAQARKERDLAEERLVVASEALKHARTQALPQFLEAVKVQLERLEMGSARVVANLVDLPREEWDAWGPHTCEFLYAAGEAIRPQRLSKVASGGEMSRIMLALKVVLGASDAVDTLVFDEIDAGVGGSTARSLAEVLIDLSRTHQVIVVTHLPQVAVCGDAHYVVRKTGGAHPETTLAILSHEERAEEVARMLSGEVNDVSLAHARELLEERKGR